MSTVNLTAESFEKTVLDGGIVVFDGRPEQFDEPALNRVYRFDLTGPQQVGRPRPRVAAPAPAPTGAAGA